MNISAVFSKSTEDKTGYLTGSLCSDQMRDPYDTDNVVNHYFH